MSKLTSLAVLAAANLGIWSMSAAESMPKVGDEAPDFKLPSQDGSDVSLKDFHGKYVVLYFYPKDGTSGCTLEAHNFQKDMSKYEADNAVVLGVSVDSANSHKNFCAKQGLTFKLLADPERRVVEQYGSMHNIMGMKLAARNTFLIGPDGKIAKEWTGVNPPKHSEEILETLASMKKQP